MENISKFIVALAERLNSRKAEMGLTYFDRYNVSTRPGKRFTKVMRDEVTTGGGVMNSSLVAFVDNATGDIFKPAGWAAPAKHARGNVNSPENGMEAITPDGFVYYLRN
jgi:hypothetical protein